MNRKQGIAESGAKRIYTMTKSNLNRKVNILSIYAFASAVESYIFHFPTHTVLELVRSGDRLLESIKPRYDWGRMNKYGETKKLKFIVHRYVTDELTIVFEQAKDWYQHTMDWLEIGDDALEHFLKDWENHSDDLPN